MGKTTLANAHGGPHVVFHTDEYIDPKDWHACSDRVSHLLDEPGPWLIEGIALPRAMRKWLLREAKAKLRLASTLYEKTEYVARSALAAGLKPPLDELIVLRRNAPPRLCEGQVSIGKGHDKVLAELSDWLRPITRVVYH